MECPSCHNDVPVTEHNYGALFTCPKCMAVYFVNFDGHPEYSEMEGLNIIDPPAAVTVIGQTTKQSLAETVIQTLKPNTQEMTRIQDPLGAVYPPIEQASLESEIVFDSSVNPFEQPSSSANTVIAAQDMNSLTNLGLPQTQEPQTFESVAIEIADFGNQDTQISGLSYDLKISGIDTAEIRSQFQEAINDTKFGWLSQDIMSMIKNGECEMKSLNPLQAFILAKRLQFLDIDMSWKQNVAT